MADEELDLGPPCECRCHTPEFNRQIRCSCWVDCCTAPHTLIQPGPPKWRRTKAQQADLEARRNAPFEKFTFPRIKGQYVDLDGDSLTKKT